MVWAIVQSYEELFDANLSVDEQKCIGCKICVNVCPVKCITMVDRPSEKIANSQEQHKEHDTIEKNQTNGKQIAKVNNATCINCGQCYIACPKKAITFPSDLQWVKNALLTNKKIYLLVAPSFVVHYGNNIEELLLRWRSCGFDMITEITYGAKLVTKAYGELIEKKETERCIVSTCPVIYSYVHLYEEHNIPFIAPVISPMVAMAKAIKKRYPNHATVFLGPCPAKIFEARKYTEIDAVLTFREFDELVTQFEHMVQIERNEETTNFDNFFSYKNKIYPRSGGLSTILVEKKMLKKEEAIVRDGVLSVHDLFENKSVPKELYFFDVLFCEGGCISGPGIISRKSIPDRAKEVNEYRELSKDNDTRKIVTMEQIHDIDMTPFFIKKNN